MSEYIQIEFKDISSDQSDMLIALLNEIGFAGFEQEETVLKAFIPKENFDDHVFQNSIELLQVNFSETTIEETNWNAVWESGFDPVIVDDFVAIRAAFHEPVHDVQYEIIITPKMSFGTGHHATTYLMLQQMRTLNFKNKSVLDFGTGKGILAILAEKLGAEKVMAIDIDEWSILNAEENIKSNNCKAISLQLSDKVEMNENFDIILANINKNVILANLDALEKQLRPGGTLLLSGLLTDDEKEILVQCNKISLKFDSKMQRLNWLFISLSHL